MNILEAMQQRRSVRSYKNIALTTEQKQVLIDKFNNSWDPFNGKVSMRLKLFDIENGFKPSTYGVITGARDFALLGIGDDDISALTAGFRFEQVVLKAWQEGLGTCWIAATFKGSVFDNGESWPDGEKLKIVSPIGFAAPMSFREKVTRFAVGSKNRKAFETLFFEKNFNTPLSIDSRFGKALEMMRLAPSSTNSQPWRALVDGNMVHFYYKPKSAASVLDCGIGICHFFETERVYKQNGDFYKEPEPANAPEDWKYIVSYKAKE